MEMPDMLFLNTGELQTMLILVNLAGIQKIPIENAFNVQFRGKSPVFLNCK